MNHLTKALCGVALLAVTAGCGASPDAAIVGDWKGTDEFGQTMVWKLDGGDLEVQLISDEGSSSRLGKYTYDPTSEPAQFNIKLDDRDEIQTILEVVDDQHIAFENVNSSDERPEEFGDRKIVLERQ